MRVFRCPSCQQVVFFENSQCLRCGTALAFDPRASELVDAGGGDVCANAVVASCNWLVDDGEPLCLSCRLTRTRPADDHPDAAAFAETEAAKRRLVFQLLELGMPTGPGLTFDLLSSREEPVVTGHLDGVITIDLAESDDAHRTAIRQQLGEPYRTMLGHLRHEVAHWYFLVLVADHATLPFRALFGDETADYAAAAERHYADGPPADWQDEHVSAYATMHPHEDWAETFAHYLHITDTLQTAAAYRLYVFTGPEDELRSSPAAHPDPEEFETLISEWLPLTYALNALNRSMGRSDLYPFVLSPAALEKLSFVHGLVRDRRAT